MFCCGHYGIVRVGQMRQRSLLLGPKPMKTIDPQPSGSSIRSEVAPKFLEAAEETTLEPMRNAKLSQQTV